MTPDRRARRQAPPGPGKITPSAAMLRIRRVATHTKRSLGSRGLADGSTLRPPVWPGGPAPGWSFSCGMPLPDEFGRLPRRHLDGQIGLLNRDAGNTAHHVTGVEKEPELPGRALGDLV